MAAEPHVDARRIRELARRRPQFFTQHFSIAFSDDSPAPMLVIAVPKRLVPSAPLRNTIRRVVRESWRAALRSGAIDRPVAALLRMRALPQDRSQEGGRPARGRAAFASRLTDRSLKRVVREESDRLLRRLAQTGQGAGPAAGAPGIPAVTPGPAARSSPR